MLRVSTLPQGALPAKRVENAAGGGCWSEHGAREPPRAGTHCSCISRRAWAAKHASTRSTAGAKPREFGRSPGLHSSTGAHRVTAPSQEGARALRPASAAAPRSSGAQQCRGARAGTASTAGSMRRARCARCEPNTAPPAQQLARGTGAAPDGPRAQGAKYVLRTDVVFGRE